jgi:G3E family GTPase
LHSRVYALPQSLNAFDLDRVIEIQPAFMGEDQQPVHDTSTTSVGLRSEKPLDKDKLNAWFAAFLKAKGAEIYRMKVRQSCAAMIIIAPLTE